jgi:predicted permease
MTPFGRNRRDRELTEEIETHLTLAEEEYRRRGMSDDEARDAARRAFGGVLKTRQMYRDQGGWRWFETLVLDARVGVRTLLRDRGFTLTGILVLGLGIGVNNMMFTIIYTHTLRALPIAGADRVLMGSLVDDRGIDRGVSYSDYQALMTDSHLFEGFGAFGGISSVSLGDHGRAPDRYLAVYTTANAFDVLRIRPLAGRTFSTPEQAPGATRVALLGEGAWRSRYTADPAVLGREVLIDGKPTVVIGIIRAESGFPSTAEVFLPIVQAPQYSEERRMLRAIGRVLNGSQVDAAQAQLTTLLANVGEATDTGRGLRPSVGPITTRFRGRATDPAWIAFYAVGFLVVAVASANAANLMLARGARRGREIAIRSSLGASRPRIVFQLLVESVVLAVAGAVVGGAVSMAGVRLFRLGVPQDAMPYWFHYSMDMTIFAALVAISLGTVIIFGLVPALHSSRTDASRILKDGGWGGTGRLGARWLTTGFMATQLGLSVVVMSYVVHDFIGEDTTVLSDSLIETPDVLTAAINLPADRYPSAGHRTAFFSQLQERARALPGVSAVALTNSLPWSGALEQRLQRNDWSEREHLPVLWSVMVSPGYFDTLRVALLQGRDFSGREPFPAAIVNERFVQSFSPDANPIGEQITLLSPNTNDESSTSVTVVGVAQDIRHSGGAPAPLVYLPVAAAPPAAISVMLRSSGDVAAAAAQLREAVLALDPNLPVHQVMTLGQAVRNVEWPARVSARLVAILSAIVLLLSTVGLYAVTAHAVVQRSKEFGIRVAIGARPRQVQRLVLSRAAAQVALGLLFGIGATYAWDNVFASGVTARHFTDPRVLVPIAGVLAFAMVLACLMPIRQALRLDPVATLRQD